MNQSLKRICETIHFYLFFSKYSQLVSGTTHGRGDGIHRIQGIETIKRQIEMQTSDLLQ
jgi:hypothetical protein